MHAPVTPPVSLSNPEGVSIARIGMPLDLSVEAGTKDAVNNQVNSRKNRQSILCSDLGDAKSHLLDLLEISQRIPLDLAALSQQEHLDDCSPGMEMTGNDVTIAAVIATSTKNGNPPAFGLAIKDVFDKMRNTPAGVFH
jgi:hypothetical protein